MSQTLPTIITIQEIIDEAQGIKTFVFNNDLEFDPGQFLMLWLPRVDEKPYGIWRTKESELRITVSAVGDFSKQLHKLNVGDKISYRGPFGCGFTVPKKKKIALVGGGFGTAPLLGLAQQAKDCDITFIIGARSKDVIFGNKYAEQFGNVLISTNDGSAGEKGFSTDILEKLFAERLAPAKAGVDMVYSCGPEIMMKKVAEICATHSVPCELSLERYMKCGFGVCGSCVMDDTGFCVCKEGPIIEGTKALQLTEFGHHHRDSVGVRKNFSVNKAPLTRGDIPT